MALNFPALASSGDTYTSDNGTIYTFDGNKWDAAIFTPNFTSVNSNILPSANVTYSLGNVTYQWKDLYVSNDTIYLSNTALAVTANGNLTVNGVVVASAQLAELVSNAAAQSSSLLSLLANAAAQDTSIVNLWANAAAQNSYISSLLSNAATQDAAISSLQSNAATQDTSIVNLWANAATQDTSIVNLWSNAGSQSTAIDGLRANITAANAAIVTANSAVKSYVDDRITSLVNGAPAVLDTLNEIATSLGNNASLSTTLVNLIANVQSNVAGANAAIVTANTAMKDYVDAQFIIASNTGNITFSDTTISTSGTGTGIVLNSAGAGEISMTDYVGIDNFNPGYWLHIGDDSDATGTPHRANLALSYLHGVAWVDGVPPSANNGFRGTAVFDWRYWTTGSEGSYSKGGQAYREIGLFKDGLLDDKLFAVDLNTHVFSANVLSVDRYITAANISLTSNIKAADFLFANGTSILSTVSNGRFIEFANGATSPVATAFGSGISGFNAYSSTDFPGNYYVGVTSSNGTVGAQFAVGWDVDNGGSNVAPSNFYIRANDDTGDTTNWSPWRRVLVDGNLDAYETTANVDTKLTGYLKLNPDGDGIAVAYGDLNPLVNGYQLQGTWIFGADGNVHAGAVQSRMFNANGHVNSTGGYYVGSVDPYASGSTANTTKVIDGDGTIYPTAGSGTAGIIFPANPGGGGGDTATIKYYAVSGEQTVFEIKTTNDADDYISLNSPGYVKIEATTDATSTTSGALRVAGGAGIAGNLYASTIVASGITTTGSYGSISGANVISANTVVVTSVVRTVPVTVVNLPGASSAGAGARAFVTDANTATFGTVVSGGGANAMPVFSNGTSWCVG